MRGATQGWHGAVCAVGTCTASPGCSVTQFPHCIRVFSIICLWVQSIFPATQLMGVLGQGPLPLLGFSVCTSRCWGTEGVPWVPVGILGGSWQISSLLHRDLARKDRNGASDPFVRLRYNGKAQESAVSMTWCPQGGWDPLGKMGDEAVAVTGGQEILLPPLERDLRVRAGRAHRGEAVRGGLGLGPCWQERFPGQGESQIPSPLPGVCPAACLTLPPVAGGVQRPGAGGGRAGGGLVQAAARQVQAEGG